MQTVIIPDISLLEVDLKAILLTRGVRAKDPESQPEDTTPKNPSP